MRVGYVITLAIIALIVIGIIIGAVVANNHRSPIAPAPFEVSA